MLQLLLVVHMIIIDIIDIIDYHCHTIQLIHIIILIIYNNHDILWFWCVHKVYPKYLKYPKLSKLFFHVIQWMCVLSTCAGTYCNCCIFADFRYYRACVMMTMMIIHDLNGLNGIKWVLHITDDICDFEAVTMSGSSCSDYCDRNYDATNLNAQWASNGWTPSWFFNAFDPWNCMLIPGVPLHHSFWYFWHSWFHEFPC